MPHVIIEYSANVASGGGGGVDIEALVRSVHRAALATGIAPMDGLRTRAVGRDHYAIADEHPDNGFVAVVARLGAGRSHADKRALVGALMDAVVEAAGDARHDLMFSVEYQDIDPDFRLNTNHVRARVAERAAERGAPA
jgi:5-carboxymethyl-2-hydroxymuconate isomerase